MMLEPSIDKLLDQVDSKYSLVVLEACVVALDIWDLSSLPPTRGVVSVGSVDNSITRGLGLKSLIATSVTISSGDGG